MKYRVLKFNGDDQYSWAVFKKSDVAGMRSPVFMGQAQPVVSGCSRSEANNYKRQLEDLARAKPPQGVV